MKEIVILFALLFSSANEKFFFKRNFSCDFSYSDKDYQNRNLEYKTNDEVFCEREYNDDSPIIYSVDYEVYGDDESSNFNESLNINVGQTYSFIFNDLHDDDFYRINSDSNFRILNFYCSKTCNFTMYRIEDNMYKEITYVNNLNTQEKLLLEADFTYFFVIEQRGNYTGVYSFSLTDVTNTVNKESLYFEASYYNSNFDYFRLKSLNYSNMLDQYLMDGSDVASIDSLKTNERARVVLGDSGREGDNGDVRFLYIESNNDFSGIFKEDGAPGESYADDIRFFGIPSRYPGNSICLISCTNPKELEFPDFYGSGFFVKSNLVFSAAHMIYNSKKNTFLNDMLLSPGCDWSNDANANASLFGEYTVLKSYFPFLYYYSQKSGNENQYNYRDYDWAIIKKGSAVIPPQENYVQNYLGYSYGEDFSSESRYVYGFPKGCPINGNLFYLRNREHKLVVSSGTVDFTFLNRLETSKIDVTAGTSGGPILYYDEITGNVYALGCVSGYDQGIHRNIFTSFNKFNCKLIEIVS